MVDLPNIEPFQQRFNEIESILSDPEIFKNQELSKKYSREHGKLKEILNIYEKINNCVKEISESRELLNDSEFADAAKEEIENLELEIPKLHQSLLISMLPDDPDAGRNTIVEIRAGTGGDEASLFASDLWPPPCYARCLFLELQPHFCFCCHQKRRKLSCFYT